MNKKLKIFLSILLTALFIFIMSSVSAFATDSEESGNPYAGKKVSVLGDSISTYSGVSNNTSANTTIGSNGYHYPSGGVAQADTWWQQTIDILGMELLVNNSWSGPAFALRTARAKILPDI